MEGEAIASRILELGPAGAKFLGPVIIEVPHFASLRGKEREIVILRSDNGENWKEHTLEATEEAVQEVLQDSFDEGGELFSQSDCSPKVVQRKLPSAEKSKLISTFTAMKSRSNKTYDIQCSLLGSDKPTIISKVHMSPIPIKSFKKTKKLEVERIFNSFDNINLL